MDALDDKIIELVKTQGYQKVSTLATQLGVGERRLYRHLYMLKAQGIIKDLVRINPILLGFRWWAKIGLNINPRSLQNIMREIAEDPSVYFITESSGIFDLVIGVRCKSLYQLHQFTNCKLPLIQGVENKEVLLHAWPRKYGSFYWPLPVNPHDETSTGENHYTLTELERGILDIITQDGPVSAAKMSAELGVSALKIRRCTKNMLDNNVYKLEVMVVPAETEYEIVATIGLTVDQCSAQNVLEDIISLDSSAIIVASFCIGKYNLVITARFFDMASLNNYVHVKLPGINGFRSADVFPHIKVFKYRISQY